MATSGTKIMKTVKSTCTVATPATLISIRDFAGLGGAICVLMIAHSAPTHHNTLREFGERSGVQRKKNPKESEKNEKNASTNSGARVIGASKSSKTKRLV